MDKGFEVARWCRDIQKMAHGHPLAQSLGLGDAKVYRVLASNSSGRLVHSLIHNLVDVACSVSIMVPRHTSPSKGAMSRPQHNQQQTSTVHW